MPTNILVVPKSMVQEGHTPPSLGVLHIAAMDADTQIIDNAKNLGLDIAEVFRSLKPKVVGVPIYTAGRVESLRVLRLAKEHGAVTVAGGPHVSVMYWQLAEHYPFIDHLVVGDGELAWRNIVQGKPMPRVIEMRVEDLSSLPLPAWDRINLLEYAPWGGDFIHRGNDIGKLPKITCIYGRGCCGSCSFCSTWYVNHGYRQYGIDWMRTLLKLLWDKGARHLAWQDDCVTVDRQGVMQLCAVLKQFNFSMFGCTRIDLMDDEMAKNLAEAGFFEISFGIESGSKLILAKMHKNVDLSAAFTAREACRKAGIKFTALMVYGYPYESDETRRETNEFLAALKPDKVCGVGHTMVLPGTALYAECKRAGLIDDGFWLGEEPYYIYRGGLS